MAGHGYTEEELAALSEQERAGIEADVDESELTATATPVDIDEGPEGEESEGDPDQEGEGDDPPGDDPDKDKPAETDTPPAETDDPPADPDLEPKTPEVDDEPESTKPVNPYDHSDAAKEQLKDLRAKLSDGDMSQAEYDEQADAIKAADYRGRLQEQENENWGKAVNGFLSADENKDYGPEGNPVKFAALDGEVRRLAGTNEINGLTHKQILAKAKANVEKAFGGGKQETPPAAKEDGPAPKPPAQRPEEPNLGDVPAAGVDNPRANTSEFAHLDKLTGGELETAIEKMSPDQYERYSAGR